VFQKAAAAAAAVGVVVAAAVAAAVGPAYSVTDEAKMPIQKMRTAAAVVEFH